MNAARSGFSWARTRVSRALRLCFTRECAFISVRTRPAEARIEVPGVNLPRPLRVTPICPESMRSIGWISRQRKGREYEMCALLQAHGCNAWDRFSVRGRFRFGKPCVAGSKRTEPSPADLERLVAGGLEP